MYKIGNNRLKIFIESYEFLIEHFKNKRKFLKVQKLKKHYISTKENLKRLENVVIYEDLSESLLIVVSIQNSIKDGFNISNQTIEIMYKNTCKVIKQTGKMSKQKEKNS